jgi:hypothetical protein
MLAVQEASGLDGWRSRGSAKRKWGAGITGIGSAATASVIKNGAGPR